MNIRENVSLKQFTTLKVGGPAKFFVLADSVRVLEEAVEFAKKKSIPLAVLSGGSNILIPDDGFQGLVIKLDFKGVEWRKSGSDVLAEVGAGERWDKFVSLCVEKGLWGLENLSGIPGTVGASPVQNIGAYGAEVGTKIVSVRAFDTGNFQMREIAHNECEFGYRDSIFKKESGDKYIITSVIFRLSKTGKPNIEYKDLAERFRIQDSGFKSNNPSLQDIRQAVLEIRRRKFPDLSLYGTAGSFFKNPIVPTEKFEELRKKYPELPGFPLRSKDERLNIKVSLAWLMDNACGLKGFSKGNVALFERQPIVLVAKSGATAKEIEEFAEIVSKKVFDETGIQIEREVLTLKKIF